jgi:integrase
MQLSVTFNMTSQVPSQINLFDTLSAWLNDPRHSYATWISQQTYRPSTQIVYRSMFDRFCTWLGSQGKCLDQCEAADIQRFLDSKNATLPESRQKAQTGRQRQQYVRQLERVFAHLGELGLNVRNPGRIAGYEKVGRGQDKPARFLNAQERESVIEALHQSLAKAQRAGLGIADWITYRDLAIVAVLLGAGLKVGNFAFLTLNCIDLTEARVELSDRLYTHRARLFDFALPSLRAWLSIQAERHGGDVKGAQPVFEADRSVGFGRLVKTPLMHPSTIHRRTERFLQAAGITGDRASAQTLRNTYAAMWIDRGATNEELVDFLGLRARVTAQRIRAAYLNFLSETSE